MRRFVLVLVLTVSASTGAFMMGADNRVPVNDADASIPGVEQVGIMRADGADFGSGLLLGENCDVVISAGHVALPVSDATPANGFRFQLDPATGVAAIAAILVDSGLIAPEHRDDDAQDWAVFRLEQRAAARCISIPIGRPDEACPGPVMMVGFHFDRPDARLVEHSCASHGETMQGLLIHDCDTKEGSSGAPLFCVADRQLALIALNTSGVAKRSYYDPGVYGEQGAPFDRSRHRNHAVPLRGHFLESLQAELDHSAVRAGGR